MAKVKVMIEQTDEGYAMSFLPVGNSWIRTSLPQKPRFLPFFVWVRYCRWRGLIERPSLNMTGTIGYGVIGSVVDDEHENL